MMSRNTSLFAVFVVLFGFTERAVAAEGEATADPAPAPQEVQAVSGVEAAVAGASDPAPPAPEVSAPTMEPGAVEPQTSIGGYAELHYNHENPKRGRNSAQLDMHRLAIFLGHSFDAKLRVYSELEVEHAVASAEDPGEVEVEQAFVEYRLLGDTLGLRAGVLLIPMGLINIQHEPTAFNGVERPLLARRIIPSTWREGGVGVFGSPVEGLNYQLYLVGGLNASGFNAFDGLRGGRGEVAEARANAFALTGRVEYEPLLGTVVGVAGYFGEAGPNAELVRADGSRFTPPVPVLGVSVDARARFAGVELRGEFATFGIGDAQKLNDAVDEDGLRQQVGSRILGYYLEAGYDVLRLVDCSEALVPFVRLEVTDTLASLPEGAVITDLGRAASLRDLVFGVSYRPIPEVVLKGDLTLREPDGSTPGVTLANLGVGFMF